MLSKRNKLSKTRLMPKLETQISVEGKFEYISNLNTEYLIDALYNFFEENNINKAKQSFNTYALLDAFRISNLNARIFDYAIPSVGYAMLSDNWEYLESIYANLSYQSFGIDDKTGAEIPLSMEEMVLDGENTVFCNTIQQLIKGDTEKIERNLNIIELVTLPKKTQNPELMNLDFEFYKAVHELNKDKCEEILNQLVTPKIHKSRNDDALLNKYVSQPALGYAKLAWSKGIEVEVNSPLVPKEILPIKPLDNYERPYEFLK